MIRFGVGDTLSNWWDAIVSWFRSAGTFTGVVIALTIAVLVWIVGRLIIWGVVRGVREGVPRSDRRLRRFPRRAQSKSSTGVLLSLLEAERRQRRAKTIGNALRSLLGVLVFFVAVFGILEINDVDTGKFLALAGIIGVALGFGAQSIVKDLLSGMFILFEDQYGVGDNVDLGEAIGTVEEVGLRVTRLRSLNGTVWFVPNGEIRRVANKSRLWSRAMVEIRVDPNVDIERARSTLLEAATKAIAHEDVAPNVLGVAEVPGIESIARDAIVLRAFVQVRAGCQWDVERAIRAEIHRVFKERKIRLAISENRIYMNAAE